MGYRSSVRIRLRKEDWKDNYKHFIEDIQTDIDNGSEDSIIEEKERLLNGKNGSYFYAYDSFNFEALTINIKEKEIR